MLARNLATLSTNAKHDPAGSRSKLDASVRELEEERSLVGELLPK